MSRARLPNSIASRGFEWLRAHQPGPHTAIVIAEAIDTEPNVLATCFKGHVRDGSIVVAKAGRSNLYSIGSGVAPAAARDEETEGDAQQQRTVSAATNGQRPVGAVSSVFGLGGAEHPTAWKSPWAGKPPKRTAKARKAETPKPARIPKPVVKLKRSKAGKRRPEARVLNEAIAARSDLTVAAPLAPPQAPATSGLQCALFNTGALFIETEAGTSVNLTAEQTRDLVAYLRKLDQLATTAMERLTA
jgi:hypothetical protein